MARTRVLRLYRRDQAAGNHRLAPLLVSQMEDSGYLATSVIDRPGSRLVIVSGDLDLGSVHELETVCKAPPEHEEIVLDLSGVEFIDVVGLRKLLQLRSSEGKTILVSPSSIVRRMIFLAGLRDAFVFREEMATCDL